MSIIYKVINIIISFDLYQLIINMHISILTLDFSIYTNLLHYLPSGLGYLKLYFISQLNSFLHSGVFIITTENWLIYFILQFFLFNLISFSLFNSL